MKLHLDSNIVEGTPEELVEYLRLLEAEEEEEKQEEAPMGYTFWYIDGGVLNHLNVLKVSLEGYFEDSKGRRYTYQAVSGLVKPIDRVDVREKFEKARHSGQLLRYYPTVDVLIREH
ncbi:hypothetical protein [Staphylococcus phage vB_SauM-T-SE-E1]|nr:hypothetical protein [Staphylococcus phage vB_SauM-V1SA15]